MARSEKCLPFEAIFILLMMYAFRNEPMRNATKLASAMRGARLKTKLKCGSFSSQKGAAGKSTAICPMIAMKKFMLKASQMTNRVRLKPQTSAMQSLMM